MTALLSDPLPVFSCGSRANLILEAHHELCFHGSFFFNKRDKKAELLFAHVSILCWEALKCINFSALLFIIYALPLQIALPHQVIIEMKQLQLSWRQQHPVDWHWELVVATGSAAGDHLSARRRNILVRHL